MSKTKKKWTAEELMRRIRSRYDPAAYVVLEQVANGTGLACRSWIDAAVISLWPSTGLWRAGMEIKVTRGDFLHELQRPAKNAWARVYFHEFWFVAPSDVIKEEELPEGAGWLRPYGNGLRIVRHASRRENVEVDDMFVAALARSLQAERLRFRRDTAEEIRESDPEYLVSRTCRAGVKRFLRSRDMFSALDSEEAVMSALTEATTGKGGREERLHILGVLDRFRNQMLGTLALFAQLAHHTILDCDETGKRVIDTWRGVDKGALESLRKAAGAAKNSSDRTSARHRLAMRTLLEQLAETPCPPEAARAKQER